MGHNKAAAHPAFSDKQGQYLAFIHAYTIVLGRPPAEVDLQRHFRVTPPSIHQMLLALERAGLITRTPGAARSIRLLIEPEKLPTLEAAHDQTVRSPCAALLKLDEARCQGDDQGGEAGGEVWHGDDFR